MHTRQNERGTAPTEGQHDRRLGPGWGLGLLAVTALVVVIAAAIWAVTSDDGSSVRQSTPVPTSPPGVGGASVEDSSVTPVEDPGRIYLWDPNSGDVKVVRSSRGEPVDAELSPDGDSLVYERLDQPAEIYLRGPDGVERLTQTAGAYDPTWSPDGSQVAFAARPLPDLLADTDIFVMNADGTHTRRLVGTKRDDVDPDWSPDGSRIAFQSRFDNYGSGIWVASVRTDRRTRLTPRETFGAMDPAWSPDGRWIAYSTYGPNMLNGKPYSASLWLMRSDGTDKTLIVRSDGGDRVSENPSWSPDGRLIVFEEHGWSGGRNRVLMINPTTGRVRTALKIPEASPSWGKEGILVSLSSGFPAPEPSLAPIGVPG